MYTYKAKVKRVIDGDTLDLVVDLGFEILTTQRVRLFGVDTPETRTKDLEEKALGKEAKEFVKLKVKGSKKRIEITSEERGKFGRYLTMLYYFEHGQKYCLNKELIRLGLAREYFGGKRKGWFKDGDD